ncbi:Trk system potassium uptake protein TrkA [Cutibacterium acnes JCM 18918]|nr:Trk system potassium uptake protein TrkA [Cutibacterium acnes JCM 18918]
MTLTTTRFAAWDLTLKGAQSKASDSTVLYSKKAGIREADGFAAVSSGDNSNVLSARVVREEFGIDNVVAASTTRAGLKSMSVLGSPR